LDRAVNLSRNILRTLRGVFRFAYGFCLTPDLLTPLATKLGTFSKEKPQKKGFPLRVDLGALWKSNS
jgi:hypothetical protein